MNRQAASSGVLASAICIVAAASCASANGVETESSNRASANPTDAPTETTEGSGDASDDEQAADTTDVDESTIPEPPTSAVPPTPPSTSPSTPPPAPPRSTDVAVSDDALIFDLERVDVAMSLRSTSDASDPTPVAGFVGAAVLDGGTVVAHGYADDPTGPTFAALWTSDDGFAWTRVENSVSAAPGLDFVPVVFADDSGRATLSVSGLLRPDSDQDFGLAVSWTSSDGLGWSSDALIGNAAVADGALIAGQATFVGAADPNGEAFTAAIYEPTGDGEWSEVLLEPGGDSSLVNDVIETPDGALAVGGTVRTDPIGSVGTSFRDMSNRSGPSDAAFWRLADGEWAVLDPDEFAEKSGPQLSLEVASIGDELFVLVSDVIGYQTIVDVYRSTDGGREWNRLAFPRAINGDVGNNTDLGPARLHAIGDVLLVTEARLGFEDTRLFATVIDPQFGDAVTHELSAEFGVGDLGGVIAIDGALVGFGAAAVSDGGPTIQTVDIIVAESFATTEPTGVDVSDA